MACDISIIEVVTAGPRGASGTGSLPIGGDTNDVLTKNSAADSDASFKAPNRDALTFGGLPPAAYVSSDDFNLAMGHVTNPTCHLPFNNTIAVMNGVGRLWFYRSSVCTHTNFYDQLFAELPAGEPAFETNGLLFERESENLFLATAGVGVTQAVTVEVGETYTVAFYEGDGVLSITGNAAYPDATLGNPVTFVADQVTINLGVTGTCNKVMFEKGDLPTSYIITDSSNPFTRNISYCELSAYGNIPNTRSMSIVMDIDSTQLVRPNDAEIFFMELGAEGEERQFSLFGTGPTMTLYPGVSDVEGITLSPNPFPINQGGCRLCITISESYINCYSNGTLFHTSANPSSSSLTPTADTVIRFGGNTDATSLMGHLKNIKIFAGELTPFEAKVS